MLTCKNCSNAIDSKTQFCYYCDAPVDDYVASPNQKQVSAFSNSSRQSNFMIGVLLVLIVAGGTLLAIFSYDPNGLYKVTEYTNGQVTSERIVSGVEVIAGAVFTVCVLVGAAVYGLYKNR